VQGTNKNVILETAMQHILQNLTGKGNALLFLPMTKTSLTGHKTPCQQGWPLILHQVWLLGFTLLAESQEMHTTYVYHFYRYIPTLHNHHILKS
jgi:hypothetical protein